MISARKWSSHRCNNVKQCRAPRAGKEFALGDQRFPQLAGADEGDGVGLRHRLFAGGIRGKARRTIGQKMHHTTMCRTMAVQMARLQHQPKFRPPVLRLDQLHAHLMRGGIIGPEGLHLCGDLFAHSASNSCTIGITFSP